MSHIASSGHIGIVKYYIESKKNVVEAYVRAHEQIIENTLPTWEQAEKWVAKTAKGLQHYETDRDY